MMKNSKFQTSDQNLEMSGKVATHNERTSGVYNASNESGSKSMPPVFLGNLLSTYSADAVTDLFERPIQPSSKSNYYSIPVDRIDIKRGYCFVFLKDARSQADKDNVEGFVMNINGMEIANVSLSLRAEFARGDGRVKRKEDERRRNIQPSETLFVVNFHEETTRQEDLQMLFEPFGELVRIDMKRNYAFVQFKTITEAIKAKETTNGGKLDQSVLTVEFVARQRRAEDGRAFRDDRRRSDRGVRIPGRVTGSENSSFVCGDGRGRDGGELGRSSHDSRGSGLYDDRRGRYDYGSFRYGSGLNRNDGNDGHTRDSSPYFTGFHPRSTSRSRSPVGGHHRSSHSPPHAYRAKSFDRRSSDRYDDYRDGIRGSSPPPPPPPIDYRNRGQSPPHCVPSPTAHRTRGNSPPRELYRGDRDHRGYRH